VEHLTFDAASCGSVPKCEPPFAWRAAVRPDQAVEVHIDALPATQRRRIESLHEVGKDCGARRAVEEDDLIHDEAAAEDDLVDVRGPRRIRDVAELGEKMQVAAPARQTRGRVELGVGPRVRPFAEKEMMQLVGRYEMPQVTTLAQCRLQILVEADR